MMHLQKNLIRSNRNGRFLKLPLLSTLILVAILLAAGSAGSSAPAQTASQPTTDRVVSLPEAAPAVGPAWTFQGPSPQTNAQQDLANVPQADEPVSGALTAIATHPTNPDLVYVGAANGGVWKSTNFTDPNPTWTPLTDHLQGLSIGYEAVVMDPLDPTGDTVIVGTGRYSGYASRGDDLVGIYHTTDGGTTWTTSTDPQLSAAGITGVAARGNTLLVASENGLYRSTTGPLGTWTKISGTGGLPAARATSITPDPQNTNTLYVTFIGASGGLFRSDDLGATWTDITGNISTVISTATEAFDVAVFNDGATLAISAVLNGSVNGAPGFALYHSSNGAPFTALDVPEVFKHTDGKIGIVTDKTNPDQFYIAGGYALLLSSPFQATTTRVDASQPSGSQLTRLHSAVTTTTLSLTISDSQTYMYVSSTASFPSTTPFDITVDSEDMTVTAVTKPSWYYRLAVDRGVNGTTPAAHGSYTVVTPPENYGAPHVDINALTRATGGGLLMAAHGGIHLLPDPAVPPSAANYWVSKNGNLGVSEMHDVAYDHVTDTLIGANQDNCVVFQSAPGNLTWPVGPGYSGDGGDVAVADIGGGQSVRYASNQNLGSFQRLVYDAANNLVSETDISTSVVTDKQFTTPIAVNAADHNRLLIGGSANLYESTNMGDTINKVATVGVYHRAIAYGGYKDGVANPDVFYVADGADTFYARTSAGGAVTEYAVPSAWYIRDIVMNPDDWMHVFAADDDKVFVSTDAGATWTDITGNLLSVSSAEISTIEFVQAPSPYVVVGTRSGVFAQNIASPGVWFELGTDLPDVLVFDLDYDAVDDVLAAGTLGRGAWLLSEASKALTPAGVPPVLAMTAAPTAVDEGSTEYTYAFSVTDPGDSFTVTTHNVSTGGELVSGSLETSGTSGSFKVTFPDGPASPTIDLQVTDSTGLTSNTETTAVTVNNLDPLPAILGLPTSGSPGTPVNIMASASDPSPTDTTAGFTWYWWVFKDGATYDKGDTTLNYSFTPDTAGEYKVWLKATDKDDDSRWTNAIMTAASPDLTADYLTLTVPEGQTTENSGTFQNVNGNPLTLSASVGTLTRETLTPPDNLVSWWHADGDATDSVDGNDGTLINGAGFAAGQAGQAFSFNGINQHVSVPSSANIEMRNNFTAMAWFNVTSLAPGAHAKIITKRPGVIGPYEIELWNVGGVIKARVVGSVDGATWYSITRDDPINAGTWYHSAIVIDEDNLLSFYFDGQLVDSLQLTGPVMDHTGAAFLIGTDLGNFDPLNGLVDEVQIVDRALTASQIEAVYDHSPAVSGNWSWSLDTDDGPADSQNVTITATDDVNAEVTNLSFPLTVENIPPDKADGLQKQPGIPGLPREGNSLSVYFDPDPISPPWSDPSEADFLAGYRYAFDFDNDGVFDLGDGTYAGSNISRLATVPASYLADGPGPLTIRGRVLDKDDGYNDYILSDTIINIRPTVSVSGPATALVGQLVPFVVEANDASAVDQAAGFEYSIDWGDGSPAQIIDRTEGNGDMIAQHAYAATGNYTIQVTATDKDGGTTFTPGNTALQVNALDPGSLQTLIDTAPFVELAVEDDAALQSQITAINGLTAPASPKAITLVLGAGPYSGVTLSPPNNIILNLAGNDTRDVDGTQIASSSGPAVTVSSGEVFVQGAILATTADAPAVLVTGGHLTLDQDEILESPGFIKPAVQVSGGSANLGFDVLMKVDGVGAFVSTYARSALVPHPEGIDAELTPNTYQMNDGLIDDTINAVSLSSTGLSSSAPATTYGEVVTFTATVDVKAIEHGPATGTVDFYDDETLMGSGTVSEVNDAFVTSYITGTLGVGEHTIMAIYNGDDAYVASSAVVTHTVGIASLPASIAISNAVDVTLSWDLNAIFCGYRAYRNLTPYFVPASADTTLADDLAANIDEFIVLNEVLAATNYFYLVTGRSCLAGGVAGDDAAVSNETGLFHFVIVPGE